MSTIEVLIATMHKENKNDIVDLLKTMNINSNSVVVSQCNKNDIEKFNYKNHSVICVFTTERGLSRSRNLALQYATADIVVIADDDVRYTDDYSEIVVLAHAKYSKYDILTFQVKDDKKYFDTEKRLNRLLTFKVSSVEITMKLSSIKNMTFNVLFGTGSSCFKHGEENIFLYSSVKKNKKIMYIPQKIAYLENSIPSTWFVGYNKNYMMDHGAVYYEISSLLVLPYILQFAFRRYKSYKKDMGCFSAIGYMISGVLKYKKILNGG